MKSLSIEEIELITLFVFEEYTQTEIAKIMGLKQQQEKIFCKGPLTNVCSSVIM